jgi:hypothetical protein
MAHTSDARSSAAQAQILLFKPDRPREIDRYIDFFGRTNNTSAREEHDDARDESMLERPA